MTPPERREHVLDAALKVIVEQGYEGVSIEAIARGAGVTRPVIYDHFPNLGALLQGLIEREEQIALSQLDEIIPNPVPTDPVELLGTAVPRFLDAVASRPTTWRIILLPLDGTPAIVRQHVESNRARIRGHLQQLIQGAARGDALARTLDTELAARSIMAMAEEAGRQVLTHPRRYAPERYARFVLSIVDRLRDPD